MSTLSTKEAFSQNIERIAIEQHVSHIEAIVSYCEENNLEIEFVDKLISKPLKEKIEEEAKKLRYLPRGSTLPL